MRIREVMTSPATTIESSDSIGHAANLMSAGRFRHLPVVRDGRHVGMISDRDAAEARARGAITALITVESFMRQDVVSVTPDASVQEASRLVVEHKIGALPVMDDGRVVGIVTRGDLCQLLAAAREWPELRPQVATPVHEHPEVWLG